MTRSNETNPWALLGAIARRQHGVVHRRQAQHAGLSNYQLRTAVARGRLRQPLSDAFVFVSSPATFRQRCMLGAIVGGVVSHETAAALHRLDGFPEASQQQLHVCFPRDHKRVLPDFVVHTWRRTDDRDITTIDGVRCTSAARTLSQLGLRQRSQVVEAALDSAIRSGAASGWIEATHARLRRPGPTGQHVLDQILDNPARSEVVTESMLETLVERAIQHPRLPTPVRQHEIQVASGKRRFDLAFPRARLGVEAHSRQFHFGRNATEADNVRDLELAASGWEVLYITWGMAQQPELFMRFLLRTYEHRRELLKNEFDASGL